MMEDIDLICPQCGNSFPAEEEFCPAHGVSLIAKPPVDKASQEAPQDVPETAEDGSACDGDTPTQEPSAAPDHRAHADHDATVDPLENSRLGKLIKVLRLKGFRPRQPPPQEVDPAPDVVTPEPTATSPLPREVSDMGWMVHGLPISHSGADHWPVQRETPTQPLPGVFCLLPSGSLTPPALYKRLADGPATCQHRARLWQHGTTDRGHGIRADYELASSPHDGVELSNWLRDTSPGEARALSLLPALHRLLQALHDEGVVPLVLEPGMLVMRQPVALSLSHLWALAAVATNDAPAVLRYRPEFQRTLLLPVPWAAPELSASQVESANAAAFSVGQLLACALWGQPATHQELRSGALPFHAIAHEGLARLLQLCLWHLPQYRLSLPQLLAGLAAPEAVARMPAAPAWSALMPGAATHAYALAGASHWRLEDLLTAAVRPSHWDESARQIESILEWAKGTAWASIAELLLDALRHGGRSPDWALMHLSRRVRPHAPITWRSLDLGDAQAAASLVALAQGALAGDPDQLQLVQRLFQADLSGALLT